MTDFSLSISKKGTFKRTFWILTHIGYLLSQMKHANSQGIICFCLFSLHAKNPFMWFSFTLSSLTAKHSGGGKKNGPPATCFCLLLFSLATLSHLCVRACVRVWGCVSLRALEKTLQSRTAVPPRWAFLDVYPRGCFCLCPNNAHPQLTMGRRAEKRGIKPVSASFIAYRSHRTLNSFQQAVKA